MTTAFPDAHFQELLSVALKRSSGAGLGMVDSSPLTPNGAGLLSPFFNKNKLGMPFLNGSGQCAFLPLLCVL